MLRPRLLLIFHLIVICTCRRWEERFLLLLLFSENKKNNPACIGLYRVKVFAYQRLNGLFS